MNSVTLSKDELIKLTGYRYPCKQLEILHKRGFNRAYMSRHGVVLERAHFEAVCKGEVGRNGKTAANLTIFGRYK